MKITEENILKETTFKVLLFVCRSIPGEASHLPSSPTSNVTVRTPSHGAHSVMSHFGQSPNGAGNGTLANDSIGDFNAVFNRLRLSVRFFKTCFKKNSNGKLIFYYVSEILFYKKLAIIFRIVDIAENMNAIIF